MQGSPTTMGCLGGLAHGFKTMCKPCARTPKQPIVLLYMVEEEGLAHGFKTINHVHGFKTMV